DAAEETEAEREYEIERKFRVKKHLKETLAPHKGLAAALAEAFPGDPDSQLAAAEMALSGWKEHAAMMDRLRTGRTQLIGKGKMGQAGLELARLRRANRQGKETDGTIAGFDTKMADHAHEFPELFTPLMRDERSGLLVPAPGSGENGAVTDSEREAAFLENLVRPNEHYKTLPPEHPAFLGGALDYLTETARDEEDEAVP